MILQHAGRTLDAATARRVRIRRKETIGGISGAREEGILADPDNCASVLLNANLIHVSFQQLDDGVIGGFILLCKAVLTVPVQQVLKFA